jgi:hypothetical protein
MPRHEQTIESAFTAQAADYNTSPTTNAASILDALVELAAPERSQRWLDAACGPGIVSRHLAPLVAEIHGLDITPAMVALARRVAEQAQTAAGNATFQSRSATASARSPCRCGWGPTAFPHSSWTSAPTGSNGARKTAAQPSVSTTRRCITAPVCSA